MKQRYKSKRFVILPLSKAEVEAFPKALKAATVYTGTGRYYSLPATEFTQRLVRIKYFLYEKRDKRWVSVV